MKKILGTGILIAILASCGGNTPPTDPANNTDIEASPSLESQEVKVCTTLRVDDPHESSTRSIYGYAKVNGAVVCPGGASTNITVKTQMFLQMYVDGRWQDVEAGKVTTKIATPFKPASFGTGEVNAFRPCTPGLYRGRLWIDRSGSLKNPVIDPFKNLYLISGSLFAAETGKL